MTRFFASPEELGCQAVALTGENANHARVLRLKNGEQVMLCDGQGFEALCTVETDGNNYTLHLGETTISHTEPCVRATVYMAMPKADKLEHVVQKATELGAYEIVTFPTARCVSRPDEKSLKKKLERWQKIAASAAEQSGRGRIPEVIVLNSFSEALKRAADADCAILFYENERANTLRGTLTKKKYSSVSLMSGPEGGFELWEVTQAMDAGLQICTLGTRILRCETAPLCALSAVMYDCGEF